MSLIDKLSEHERTRVLHVMRDAESVNRHFQLFLWLQGEFQQFLPHDILIAAVGDFSAQKLNFDVVSALPDIRTENLLGCSTKSLVYRLFTRWNNHQRQMLTDEGALNLFDCNLCNCQTAQTLQKMRSVLIHGARDERSGDDALYIFLSHEPDTFKQRAEMLALLLAPIDFACRRVTSLAKSKIQLTGTIQNPPLRTDRNGEMLSAREMEILEWVSQGKTNGEIGIILNISAFTVKNHLQRVFRKINVTNRAQAASALDQLKRYPHINASH